ncbi:TetR/AcrR family transcriptional regulator [Streptomyces sp. HB2AG]|uniref:TetR/AcrR family transcriptional regulator n=1 Tax=Streptomyces sp. HB2AG TaxID=2983400 RepID=UPI0022AA490D|nr:TetR family transcriptional regulator C-terminal domain-containing protein [Streptomyces sp. HB2AG]MCZ2523426.1 TetR family transcriptional regulator C-terminal domain-containing protein [Streptomyces sp. HB2AG]
MARTADHEARRRQIAAALRALMADAGLDAATVAEVARRAGFSVGLVQHYFPNKDALLLFAYNDVMADIGDRVAARISEGDLREEAISAIVLASVTELLPVDDGRRGEYRVTRAFRGRSLDNPALVEVTRATWADLRSRLAAAVDNGKKCGEVGPDTDATMAATRILALVDGLADQLHMDPAGVAGGRPLPVAAEEIVRACLDGVFTGECQYYRR